MDAERQEHKTGQAPMPASRRWLVAALLAAATGSAALAGLAVYRGIEPRIAAPQLILLISVDPGDSLPQLQNFSRRHGADPSRWKFLTGGPEEIARIEKACNTRSKYLPGADRDKQFAHTPSVFLLDRQGTLRGRYAVAEEILDDQGKPTERFRVNPEAIEALLTDAAELDRSGRLNSGSGGESMPDFALSDQDGVPFSRRSMGGKITVVGFIFTCCSTSCPRIVEAMAEVQRRTAAGPKRVHLPAVNAGLNATAAVLLVIGYLAIRLGRRRLHAGLMLAAVCISALFLASYLYYHFVETGGQPTYYSGPPSLRGVYLAILWSHIVLATLIVPLAALTLYRAARDQLARHRRLARWTLPIWLYVSVTGVVVYWMLYELKA
jgi:uncharacterized membrane protein YozB (DUF420 family)